MSVSRDESAESAVLEILGLVYGLVIKSRFEFVPSKDFEAPLFKLGAVSENDEGLLGPFR